MVNRRQFGKFTIIRVQNPDGTGNSYYGEAGPEGRVLAVNAGNFPAPVIAAILAWELEPPKTGALTPSDPQPEFNRKGWAL